LSFFLHHDMTAALPHPKKPWWPRMAQTSLPERTRSLPNLYLKPSDKYFGALSSFDLGRICRFEEKLDGLLQIQAADSMVSPLARDIEFGASPT
jgi:hypothetical protein